MKIEDISKGFLWFCRVWLKLTFIGIVIFILIGFIVAICDTCLNNFLGRIVVLIIICCIGFASCCEQ